MMPKPMQTFIKRVLNLVQKPAEEALLVQARRNAQLLRIKKSGIYPYWVYDQCMPDSPHFVPRAGLQFALNMTHRNWTSLRVPGQNDNIIVDPKGLLTVLPGQWSVDHYLLIDGQLVCPARLKVIQSLDPELGAVITQFSHNGVSCTTQIAMQTGHAHPSMTSITVTIQNGTTSTQTIQLILAIKPFSPEGVSPIRELVYLSKNRVMINGQVGIVLPEKPENIVFVAAKDGDSCDQIGKWDLILTAKCEEGMASGHVSYPFALSPNQSKSLTYHIPVDAPIGFLDKPATSTPVDWIGLQEAKMRIHIPDPTLQALYDANIFHLLGSIGKSSIFSGGFTTKHSQTGDTKTIVLAMQKLGFSAITTKLLKGLLDQMQSSDLIPLYLTQFIYDTDPAFLEATFTKIVLWAKTVERSAGRTIASQSIVKTLWNLETIRSTKEIAHILMKLEQQKLFASLDIQLTDAFQKFLTHYFECARLTPFLMAHPDQPMGSNMVQGLASVHVLRLFHPKDPLIDETLRLLETDYMIDGILFDHHGLDGYCCADNALLAQTYALRQDAEKSHRILKWLSTHANPTGSFAHTIHPNTGGGSSGDGHCYLASAQFCLLIRSLLVQEESDYVHLFPAIPAEWLTQSQPIRVQHVPTQWGILSFSLTPKSTHEWHLQFEGKFQKPPREIWVSLPHKITSVSSQKGVAKLTGFNTFVMSPDATDVAIVLDS